MSNYLEILDGIQMLLARDLRKVKGIHPSYKRDYRQIAAKEFRWNLYVINCWVQKPFKFHLNFLMEFDMNSNDS